MNDYRKQIAWFSEEGWRVFTIHNERGIRLSKGHRRGSEYIDIEITPEYARYAGKVQDLNIIHRVNEIRDHLFEVDYKWVMSLLRRN